MDGYSQNYQKKLDAFLMEQKREGIIPHLLLHACCAPCSSYCLEYLSSYFRITVFYYNPNITKAEEYRRRTQEIERLVREMKFENPVDLLEGTYDPGYFFDNVRGLEKEPEGGARCEKCFELRLKEAAKKASDIGAQYVTTTLTISPLKNAALLNEIGDRQASAYGVKYLFSDFKKRDGYKRSIELSKEYGLYRQDYCGCIFSEMEARQKRQKSTQPPSEK